MLKESLSATRSSVRGYVGGTSQSVRGRFKSLPNPQRQKKNIEKRAQDSNRVDQKGCSPSLEKDAEEVV